MRVGFQGWALAAVSVSFVAGCGDSFEGTWKEVDPACASRSTITVAEDLTGDGIVYVQSAACQSCSFTFSANEKSDDSTWATSP